MAIARALTAAAMMFGGCAELRASPAPPLEASPEDEPADAQSKKELEPIELDQAVARIAGDDAEGTIELTQTSEAVVVDGELRGLRPGRHSVHVHAASDCGAEVNLDRAGECLDRPAALGEASERAEDEAGPEPPQGPGRCIADLGTVEPDADGVATLEAMVPAITIEPGLPNSVPGRIVVVHRWGDDWARDPEARPGPVVACGVVRRIEPMS